MTVGGALLAQTPAPSPKVDSPAKQVTTAPAPDKIVLAIGDEKMTASQYEAFIDGLPEQYRAAARGPEKRQVIDQLVNLKTLAQEARRRKLDQNPQFKAQVAFQTESLLAGTVFRELSANLKVPEADARKYYEEHKGEYDRVTARHILLRFKGSSVPAGDKKELSEDEALEKAKALRAKIVAGGDFAIIAKAESDDTGSGANGGVLGTFGHGQMVAAFDQAAFALAAGQLSEPVKSPFGYHLILVDKRETKSFDEARPEIEKQLLPGMADKVIDNLKSQTPIQIDEAYFGVAPAK